MFDHETTLTWIEATKATCKAQPLLALDYTLRAGVKLRCEYRPPMRKGKLEPVSAAYEAVCFVWQLWTKGRYAAQRADPILADWTDEQCGWEWLSIRDVIHLLEGESTGEMRLRHESEADAIFARLK